MATILSTARGLHTVNAETDDQSLVRRNPHPREDESGSSQGQMSLEVGMPQPAREVDYVAPGLRGWRIPSFFGWDFFGHILNYFIPIPLPPPHQPQQNESKRITNAEAVSTAPTYGLNMGSNNQHSGNINNANNSTINGHVGAIFRDHSQAKTMAPGATFHGRVTMS